MDVNPKENGEIVVGYSSDEPNSTSNNREEKNTAQNLSDNEEIPGVVIKMKTNPMNPTPLEYSCCSTYPTEAAVGVYVLFIVVVIFIGVLIVCFTTPKPELKKCHLHFIATSSNPIQYNYGPRSVAVGHFNNDTWLDAVIANYDAHFIDIFLGNGDGTFTSYKNYLTGENSSPYMVTVADVNGDHRLDIAVANFGTNSIGIFLGLGDGSFQQQTLISTGSSRPLWMHIAHFNNDTFLDLVTANYGTQSVGVLLGYGNGSFTSPTTYSTGYDSSPLSVVAGDFNNDNYLDLAVANSGTDNIGIFLGDGNGSFSNQTTFSTGHGSRPHSVVLGNFNNDKLLDIAVANYGTYRVGILHGYSNGTFARQITYSLGTASPYCLAIADMTLDNRLDIIVVNKGSNNLGLLRGYSNGTFSTAKMYSMGSTWSISLAIGDFNSDHRLDVMVVNKDTSSTDIFLSYDAGFLNQTTLLTGDSPNSVAVGDFNNDKYPDIIVTNNQDKNVSVHLGYGNGSFSSQVTYSTGLYPKSVTVGDFNNDNHLDIVVANLIDNNVSVLLGYGNGSFADQLTYSTGLYPQSVAVGDFNNDNYLDIVVVYNVLYSNVDVLLGYGNGTFATPITSRCNPGANSVTVGDFDSDGRLDIAVSRQNRFTFSGSFKHVGILLGYGNGSFNNETKYPSDSNPAAVACGDFNNDTRLDMAVISYDSRTVGVLIGYGNGSFANQTRYPIDTSPEGIAISDFNNDTQLDIIFISPEQNTIGILFGYGNGSFADQIKYPVGPFPTSLAVADFNSDTKMDIVVTNQIGNNVGVLLHVDDVLLKKKSSIASGDGSFIHGIALSDFNNDDSLDITIANYGTDNVDVILGHGNGSFTTPLRVSSRTSSHPNSMIVRDFNGDTHFDIAVTDMGGKYVTILLGDGNGTFKHPLNSGIPLDFTPFIIAAADFDNDHQSEIVVAYADADNVDIFATYDPTFFTRRVTRFDDPYTRYLAAGDFNNDGHLDILATHPTSYYIAVLLGRGDGSFSNEIRYSTDREAVTVAVAVADFNNDSYLDIVWTDSAYHIICVLLGYGNGSFAKQTQYPTGIRPNSVTTGDFNGDSWVDIAVSNIPGTVSIHLGYGNGSFADYVAYPSASLSWFVTTGDFNNDTLIDIVVIDGFSTFNILLGYGNGSFDQPNTYPIHSPSQFVVVADFNNDTRLDLVIGDSERKTARVLLGYGNGSFLEQSAEWDSNVGSIIAVGDFNADARLDMVATNGNGDSINLFLGRGDGSFAYEIKHESGYEPYYKVVGDFNNDTRLDFVVGTSYGIDVFLGSASALLDHKTTLFNANGSQPRSFAIGDFDHNNHMDIALVNFATNNLAVFLGYGNYSFIHQRIYSTGVHPLSAAVGHFNNDTNLDIVVANSDDDSISILLGYGNGSFVDQVTFSTGPHSQPHSVAVTDFNNDTFADIIVANYGSDNVGVLIGDGNGSFADVLFFYTGYRSRPLSIVVGDFNKDRKQDFAVVNEGFDNVNIFLQTCLRYPLK